MKKIEAMELAPERSKLLCEYITQILSDNEKILSDNEKVNGEIKINFAKINNEHMITFDILIPSKNFVKQLNTGITTQQIDVLTEQILNDLLDTFLESETIGCTRYYSVKGGYGTNMNGVNAMNTIGSKLKINFVCRGDKFNEQVENYNERINEYANRQEKRQKL